MLIIPAVDIRGGRAVRLREGRADAETVVAGDPVAAAVRWARLGCERLHVVDLDGAFGRARQTSIVAEIIAAVTPVPVEVGGGLRDVAAIEGVLTAGARWALVGTRAALDPEFLRAAGRAFGERLIVAVDARGARVAVKGWTEVVEETVTDIARRALDAGAGELLYTDVSRDGTETGPNVDDTAALARAVAMPILASGGVATVADLVRLATVQGVRGTVVGRALYAGAIDLREAMSAVRSSAGSAGATSAVLAVGGVGEERRSLPPTSD
jgi:phosphoribosylformimino-5-aminoimidazole carboxamide ribotide isomerase